MPGIKKATLFLTVVFLMAVSTSAMISCAPAPVEEEVIGKYGGILKIAYGSAPPSLDVHRRFTTATHDIGSHIFQTLFVYDSSYLPRPELAESHNVSEDGLTHTIELRQGVLFHDGTKMTAEDVVASINRYFSIFPIPTALEMRTESIEVVGDYTVEYRLKGPYPNFLDTLAATSIVIMPNEICEEFFETELTDDKIIGTGPYKLKAHAPGRHVYLERFEGYVGRVEAPDGYFGKNHAFLDEIRFYILPDPSVREMGVEAGEYQFAHGVNFDAFRRIKANPDLQALIIEPSTMVGILFNCAQGPTTNLKVRQAMQAAIDVEPILRTAFVYEEFYDPNPALMSRLSPWFTEAGSEFYDQADPEKARRLLEEAGYDGEPIIMIGVSDFEYLRNVNLMVAGQLEAVGINIDLQLVDQGTFIARLFDPRMWHAACSVSMFTPRLGLENLKVADAARWIGEDPQSKLELENKVLTEMDFDRRFAYFEQFQLLAYKEVPMIRIGEGRSFAVAAANTAGFTTNMHGPRFYNVYFKNQ
ncbi:MAG: Glutathione-binding protein GsiB [Syntrophomonadaceae bacterium]|nr:Glutathione-binding protein GsiB [Bacillota bacterium]